MYVLTKQEEWLSSQIVDCAFRVHKELGPGLLERIYEKCFCYELGKHEISYERQVLVPIKYDSLIFNEGLRVDVMVENMIICELKAVETIHPIVEAQILSYLKMTGKNVGFRINFNVDLIKNGIRRYALK